MEFAGVDVALPDGRPLLDEVTFRVGEGERMALIGPNGSGKTTLVRIAIGDTPAQGGAVTGSGSVGVMRQFIGQIRDETTVEDLVVSLAEPALAGAARALRQAEAGVARAQARVESADNPSVELSDAEVEAILAADADAQMAYAHALADWADVAGYQAEAGWDDVTSRVMGQPWDEARLRPVRTLSGGEQKKLVLEMLLASDHEVLILDEPDNYLDIPAKRWLEQRLTASNKTVLFVSHDRELLANVATSIVTLEPGAAGATAWVHGGGYATYAEAREARNARLDELLRRWDEEHAKLKALVAMYKQKAAYNDAMSSRLQAARSRLARFEQAGPPEKVPTRQQVTVRLKGGRTGRRAVMCEQLALTGLTQPFDQEFWFGERVAILGPNGSGKSHFLRLLALGGSDPDAEHRPVESLTLAPVAHTGTVRLGARVRPGWFAQTHAHPEFAGRSLLDILHRGDEHRDGMGREPATRALDRYGLAKAAEQTFETLSGGQQARFQILLLELSGATLLLLDEPTDNLDLDSSEALEIGLASFEGTVVAVTHDRWFLRGFDRSVVFGADGDVYEGTWP